MPSTRYVGYTPGSLNAAADRLVQALESMDGTALALLQETIGVLVERTGIDQPSYAVLPMWSALGDLMAAVQARRKAGA